MARKTFISYKYSEAQDLRNRIIDALGDDATYYKGETSASSDLTDRTTETIKENLKDMLFGTSVTIVVVSPNMIDSKWIDWEIEYSLREYTRDGVASRTNGVVGVIMKVDGSYGWLVGTIEGTDGCSYRTIDSDKLYKIINENRLNRKESTYSCSHCKTVDILSGSYFSLVTEEDFLNNASKYIENAYDKSQALDDFNISKTR